MKILKGMQDIIPAVRDIAGKTWAVTYANILSQEQIDYMLEMMYSQEALEKQMIDQDHHFLIVQDEEKDYILGFVSYELNYNGGNKTKIHKLYVLPDCHGAGIGRNLVEKVCEIAQLHNNDIISLNMNRFNKTLGFYKRMGFEIVGEEDIDIGNGYLMEDYIFEKRL